MNNVSSISTFLLLEFSNIQELQITLSFVFLLLYLISITGNLAIVVAVALDYRLHTPMYFFLLNLAILDLAIISVMVPKSIAMALVKDRSISYSGCVAQVFFYFFFASADLTVLTIMAHDRRVAICKPLQYDILMHKRGCFQMVAFGWAASFLNAALHTGGTFAITFCSNNIKQFFCEIPQLLKLSCSDLYLVEVGFLVFSCSITTGCFLFIIITYVQIFATVLKIPSITGQKKALSTCLPHLTVVSVFVFSGVFAYARPKSNSSTSMDIAFAVIYAIIPPMLNPFIYSMRNREIKVALWKLLNLGLSSKTLFGFIV